MQVKSVRNEKGSHYYMIELRKLVNFHIDGVSDNDNDPNTLT